MSHIAVHIIVKGKVQGVFFRRSTRQKAQELRLTGWVRNLENGDVEIEVEGDENTVQEFIGWCSKGPEKANVTGIITDNITLRGFSDFKVK